MMEIEVLHTFDTEYSADSVEWCQTHKDIFAIGTYELEEKDENVSANNVRKGRIYLFHYSDDNELTKKQQIETDAILDQKWNGSNLITATSSGHIQRYTLNDSQNLEKLAQVELSSEDCGNLALSIDIHKDTKRILASDSKGRISLIDEAENSIIRQWMAHDFEAWTCAFDRYNNDIVFSGKIEKLNVSLNII
jgi:diphthine methyl ester acylhydrolase